MSEPTPSQQYNTVTTTTAADCRKAWYCACGATLGFVYRETVTLSDGTPREIRVLRTAKAPDDTMEAGTVYCPSCGERRRFHPEPEFARRRRK